jgi:hypothetical protein
MYSFLKYKTFDGVEHDTVAAAKRHLDKLYSDCICKVATQMRGLDYVEVTEHIDKNLAMFQRLATINADDEEE